MREKIISNFRSTRAVKISVHLRATLIMIAISQGSKTWKYISFCRLPFCNHPVIMRNGAAVLRIASLCANNKMAPIIDVNWVAWYTATPIFVRVYTPLQSYVSAKTMLRQIDIARLVRVLVSTATGSEQHFVLLSFSNKILRNLGPITRRSAINEKSTI